jgi:hypothetical protein
MGCQAKQLSHHQDVGDIAGISRTESQRNKSRLCQGGQFVSRYIFHDVKKSKTLKVKKIKFKAINR